jgi:antirestriction protein
MNDTPRIWVGCLASYNAGHLFGEWMDADDGEDVVNEKIADLLRRSPNPNVEVDCPTCYEDGEDDCKPCKGTGKVPSAEEFHICDAENFQGFDVGRYSSISEVCKAAELAEQYGEAFQAACSAFCGVDEAVEALEERYHGSWDSAADYAEEFARDCGTLENVPEQLAWCIDWERYAQNMELTEVRIGSSVHIFSQC